MLTQTECTALKTRAEARLVCNTQDITMSECEDLTNTWKGGGNGETAPHRMGATPAHHLQGRSQAQTRGLPLVMDQSCYIYYYK